MALIYCRECGHRVSDRAATCPRCGFPLNNNSTGNQSGNNNGNNLYLYIIIGALVVGAIILSLFLLGSNSNGDHTNVPKTEINNPNTPPQAQNNTPAQAQNNTPIQNAEPAHDRDEAKPSQPVLQFVVNSVKGTGACLRKRPSTSSKYTAIYSDGTLFEGYYSDVNHWIVVVKNGHKLGYIHDENVNLIR